MQLTGEPPHCNKRVSETIPGLKTDHVILVYIGVDN